jgi:hypothetical protein
LTISLPGETPLACDIGLSTRYAVRDINVVYQTGVPPFCQLGPGASLDPQWDDYTIFGTRYKRTGTILWNEGTQYYVPPHAPGSAVY